LLFPDWSLLCSFSRQVSEALLRRLKSRRVTPLKTYVSGDVLVTRFEARSASIQKGGADPIILWGIREFRGDKIASSRCCLPDRTDPPTARFLEWDYAASDPMRMH